MQRFIFDFRVGFKNSSATFVINIFEGYGGSRAALLSPQTKGLKSSSAKSSRAALFFIKKMWFKMGLKSCSAAFSMFLKLQD